MGKGQGRRNEAKQDQKKAELIKALGLTFGNIGQACKMVKCSRQLYYHYLDNDADFEQAVKDAEKDQTDFVESCLMKEIKNGNAALIKFHLERRSEKYYPLKQTLEATEEPTTFVIKWGDNKAEIK